MENKESLIFIPDITGFTEFVNNTELEHGQHIISELLELIVKANTLDMTVSEVEGDAILFYKYNHIPSLDALVEQAKKIFVDFHTHLKKYEQQRICNCGACTSAADLSVKIIAHCGEIGFTTVLGKQKPFGKALVMAHKLLKNEVDEQEYLLFTKPLPATDSNALPDWVELKAYTTKYPDMDAIAFQAFSLTPCMSEVKNPPALEANLKVEHPPTLEQIIDKPVEYVFEMASNLGNRLQWTDLNDLEYDASQINQNGVVHKCVFDSGTALIETLRTDSGEDFYSYGEKIVGNKLAKSALFNYKFYPHGPTQTRMVAEIHIIPWPIIGQLIKALVIKKLIKNLSSQLPRLKELCETGVVKEMQAKSL